MNKAKSPGAVITSTQPFPSVVCIGSLDAAAVLIIESNSKVNGADADQIWQQKYATMTGRYITWPYNFIIASQQQLKHTHISDWERFWRNPGANRRLNKTIFEVKMRTNDEHEKR